MLEQATAFQSPKAHDPAFAVWEKAGERTSSRFTVNDRTAGPIPAFGTMVHANVALTAAYAPQGRQPDGDTEHTQTRADIQYEAKDDGFSFDDVIDIINPLQHIPVLSMFYRNVTGDTIKPFANIIGGAIFGGPVGAVSSTINSIVKTETGKDIAENALSLIGFNVGGETPKPDIQYGAQLSYDETQRLDSASQKVADLYGRTQKNFAANHSTQPSQTWNT